MPSIHHLEINFEDKKSRFSVQMQLASISQEFSKIVQYEEDLQNQYRAIFLNLINIYLDSLVQQKLIEPEQKQQISDQFNHRLKDTEAEWKNKISSAIQVIQTFIWAIKQGIRILRFLEAHQLMDYQRTHPNYHIIYNLRSMKEKVVMHYKQIMWNN